MLIGIATAIKITNVIFIARINRFDISSILSLAYCFVIAGRKAVTIFDENKFTTFETVVLIPIAAFK